MDLKRIISQTDFQRKNKKFNDLIAKGDVVVVKNNKPAFVAVKPENYKKSEINLGDIILRIRKNKDKLINNGIISIGVFGSYAKGKETANSDIDLLYITTKKGLKAIAASKMIENLFPEKETRALPKQASKKPFLDSIAEDLIYAY